MKKRIKSKNELNREHELAREKKQMEFEEQYCVEKKEWEEFGFDLMRPFDSLEEFVEKNMDEWERQQLKIPTGKYQDKRKIDSNYQQKFVEYTQQICPQIIEELREFVAYFDSLFGEEKDKYNDIFDTRKMEISALNSSLHNKINYLLIKDKIPSFKSNKLQSRRFDYNWGEYSLLFHFLYFLFVQEEVTDKRNEITKDILKLLQLNLVKRDYLKFPDDFDESILQNYVSKSSYQVIEKILLNDEQKNFRKEAKQKIIKFLQDISPTPETGVADFIKLQIELLKWAERHNLQKNWILRYAYFFLSQFSRNPKIKLDEIEIPALNLRSLYAYPFEFKFNGWFAGDEDRKDYEKRITESFELELQQYFHNVSVYFGLEEKKRITKPVAYDRVKWLVRWTVQGWTKEQIREEIDREFQSQGMEKYIDISTIDKAFRQFKEFDLPIRD